MHPVIKLLALTLLCFLAFVIYTITPIHKPVNWVLLDLTRFNREVDQHMRNFHGTAEYACVYTFACVNNEAVLELRTHLSPSQFSSVKAAVWRRKFENYCPGPTTNFGLENSGETEAIANGKNDDRRRDIWFDGAFEGADGNFFGGSFAPEGRWTPCTRDKAYWTREKGLHLGKLSPLVSPDFHSIGDVAGRWPVHLPSWPPKAVLGPLSIFLGLALVGRFCMTLILEFLEAAALALN